MSPWPWVDPAMHLAVLAAALAWDRWLGEPPARAHPVVWMGSTIRWFRDRAPARPLPAFALGLAMALGLPLGFSLLAGLVGPPWAGPVLAVWLLTSSFAATGLLRAGEDVAEALDAGELELARRGLRSLCSRDPAELSSSEVAAAATESVAENTSDSVVAPLFWYACAGLPGVLAYRCVNTLDAMIGYRGRYEWLGKASARLDDLLNLVPARITALLLLASADATSSRERGAATLWRDRRRTDSPNAGWPMAAMSGLLGVELAKPGHYVLGAGLQRCDAAALRRACGICGRAMALTAVALVAWLVGATWS